MMYVVKVGSNPRNWMWFNTHDAAQRCVRSYGAPSSGFRAELNLTKPYHYYEAA